MADFRAEVKALQELSRDSLEELALQWIHNKRNREIVLERLLESTRYEVLAEEFELSTTRTKEIVRECVRKLSAHLS